MKDVAQKRLIEVMQMHVKKLLEEMFKHCPDIDGIPELKIEIYSTPADDSDDMDSTIVRGNAEVVELTKDLETMEFGDWGIEDIGIQVLKEDCGSGREKLIEYYDVNYDDVDHSGCDWNSSSRAPAE